MCVPQFTSLFQSHASLTIAAETICHLKLYKFNVWQLAFVIYLTEVMERSKDTGVDTK